MITTRQELEKTKEKCFVGRMSETDGFGSFVVQKFVPNLEGDWKVIIVGDAVAVLYRRVRENDFRASGSGMFEFNDPKESLLNFALAIKKKLDTPWVSLDIAEKNNHFVLLEFQTTHFGTLTVDKAPFHFLYNKGNWKREVGPVDMEFHLAEAIINFINRDTQVDGFNN